MDSDRRPDPPLPPTIERKGDPVREWLANQDWHQALRERAIHGSGMLENMQRQGPSVRMTGRLGKGIRAEGHGNVTAEIPLGALESLILSAGGAGVAGPLQTPIGQREVRAFVPEVGIGYRRRF